MFQMEKEKLAKMIDHTLLKPTATSNDIINLCNEAIRYNFATVCVNPYWVKLAKNSLKNSGVGITTVIGFPLGSSTTVTKVTETLDAVNNGATEIDMVFNIGAFKSKDYKTVKEDIEAVILACKYKAIVKVIFEVGYLDNEEIIKASQLAEEAGVNFIKTSTGFGVGNATEEIIALMRKSVSLKVEVKASGGVRDLDTAIKMINSGATRIGTSSGVSIMQGIDSKSNY
jgi:deoxyribose-phosphate aldolase